LQFILEGARRREPGLYVTLEEGPEQLIASADALGLPLKKAVDEGLVEILYLSRDYIRAGQVLTVLADKLQALLARRLVLDAATHLMMEHLPSDELRHLLYKLVVRFKMLGVTSLLTLEAASLHSTDYVTERSLSPIADNLLMLRYTRAGNRLDPTLTVVKTRGSAHDRSTCAIPIGKGGMRVEPLSEPGSPPAGGRPRARKPSPKKKAIK
jgi:circadian clock protein KaiC